MNFFIYRQNVEPSACCTIFSPIAPTLLLHPDPPIIFFSKKCLHVLHVSWMPFIFQCIALLTNMLTLSSPWSNYTRCFHLALYCANALVDGGLVRLDPLGFDFSYFLHSDLWFFNSFHLFLIKAYQKSPIRRCFTFHRQIRVLRCLFVKKSK